MYFYIKTSYTKADSKIQYVASTVVLSKSLISEMSPLESTPKIFPFVWVDVIGPGLLSEMVGVTGGHSRSPCTPT